MKTKIVDHVVMILTVAVVFSVVYFTPEIYRYYYKLLIEPLVIETIKETK